MWRNKTCFQHGNVLLIIWSITTIVLLKGSYHFLFLHLLGVVLIPSLMDCNYSWVCMTCSYLIWLINNGNGQLSRILPNWLEASLHFWHGSECSDLEIQGQKSWLHNRESAERVKEPEGGSRHMNEAKLWMRVVDNISSWQNGPQKGKTERELNRFQGLYTVLWFISLEVRPLNGRMVRFCN